jgi:signal transduction histidine kinase
MPGPMARSPDRKPGRARLDWVAAKVPAAWPWTRHATIASVGLRTRVVEDGSVSGNQVRLGRGVRVALGLGVVGLGLLAEWLGGPWPSPSALVDLAAGWVLTGSGLTAWSRRPRSRVGPLLVLSGYAWFLGTLATSDLGWLSIIGGVFLMIHRAPLMHSIVGYPTGRISGRVSVALVIAAYVYAVVVPIARDGLATIAIAASLMASTIWTYHRSTGPHRQARLIAVAAAAVLVTPLLTGSVGRLAEAGPDLEAALNWIYPIAVALVGVILAADLSRARWAEAEVTRLVVDLGDPPMAGIRGRLAQALGDPSLELLYWLPETRGYVDESGRPIQVPAAGTGRAVTSLELDGERVGALVHDAAVFDDARLLQAVAAAAQIALANVRLQADVRRHLADLEASRRRLLETSEGQRRRLDLQVRQGVGRQLSDLREILEHARADPPLSPSSPLGITLDEAQGELEQAQLDLERLVFGIQPPILAELGIGPALSALAERSGVPVRLSVASQRLPGPIESAIYFVCSEAVANVQKYASASEVVIEIRIDAGSAIVVVADDGTGGADPSAGSGLDGLRDRIAALGGSFTIDSPRGVGTRITAVMPMAGRLP